MICRESRLGFQTDQKHPSAIEIRREDEITKAPQLLLKGFFRVFVYFYSASEGNLWKLWQLLRIEQYLGESSRFDQTLWFPCLELQRASESPLNPSKSWAKDGFEPLIIGSMGEKFTTKLSWHQLWLNDEGSFPPVWLSFWVQSYWIRMEGRYKTGQLVPSTYNLAKISQRIRFNSCLQFHSSSQSPDFQ